MDILTLLNTIKNGKFALLGCSAGPPLTLQRNGVAVPARPELHRGGGGDDSGGGGGGGGGPRASPDEDGDGAQVQPLALTTHGKPAVAAAPPCAPVAGVTSPGGGGGPPASPGKRKFTRPRAADGAAQQGGVESEDEEDPATKASRLMPLNLSKSASVDYIRERDKTRGHSPLVRSASLPPRRLAGAAAAYRYAAGAASSPALAESPDPGASSPGEVARSGAPFLHAGALPAFLLQQMRPSVITCAPGASAHRVNGRHVPRPLSVSNGLGASHRREHSAASMSSDPVVEEHFRRSLGRDYRDPAATVASAAGSLCRPGDPCAASNRVSVTGSVDDHFMRALGDTWLRLRSPCGSSGDERSPHPASPPFPFSPPLSSSSSSSSSSLSSAAAAAAATSPPPPPLLLLPPPPPGGRAEPGSRPYGGQTAASPHRSGHRAPSPRVLL